MPVIREDLNMTQTQVGNANSASVAGTVFFRILMGSLCDSVGPRKAYGVLMILVSFPCFAMSARLALRISLPAGTDDCLCFLPAMVTNYAEFVTCRCAIGFSLAAFVSTQYWTTQMFTPKIVGGANAITAGWGNLGGGITQVVTIEMFQAFAKYGACRPHASPARRQLGSALKRPKVTRSGGHALRSLLTAAPPHRTLPARLAPVLLRAGPAAPAVRRAHPVLWPGRA